MAEGVALQPEKTTAGVGEPGHGDFPPAPPLSARFGEEARRLMARYPQPRSALMSLLYLAQAEQGYVSREAMIEIAGLLGLSPAQVGAVATFYTMFKRKPCGRWLISVCTNPPCMIAGGRAIVERLEQELGVRCGDTTSDGAVTLEEVECLCICDGAAVLQVNYEFYERATPESAVELVAKLRAGDVPVPTRGETPVPWEECHRRLAGVETPAPWVDR